MPNKMSRAPGRLFYRKMNLEEITVTLLFIHNRRMSGIFPYSLPGTRYISDDIVDGLAVVCPELVSSVPHVA